MSKTNKDQSPFHGIFEGCTKEQKTQFKNIASQMGYPSVHEHKKGISRMIKSYGINLIKMPIDFLHIRKN